MPGNEVSNHKKVECVSEDLGRKQLSPYDPAYDLRKVIDEANSALFNSVKGVALAFFVPASVCYLVATATNSQVVSSTGIALVAVFIFICCFYTLSIFPSVLILKCLACVEYSLIFQARCLFVAFIFYLATIFAIYRLLSGYKFF